MIKNSSKRATQRTFWTKFVPVNFLLIQINALNIIIHTLTNVGDLPGVWAQIVSPRIVLNCWGYLRDFYYRAYSRLRISDHQRTWGGDLSCHHRAYDVSPSEAVWKDELLEGGVQVHSLAVMNSSSSPQLLADPALLAVPQLLLLLSKLPYQSCVNYQKKIIITSENVWKIVLPCFIRIKLGIQRLGVSGKRIPALWVAIKTLANAHIRGEIFQH